MANDGDVVSGGSPDRTTVTGLLLDVGHDGTFGHGSKREDVANAERGLLSGVDELTSVHALVRNKTMSHPHLCQSKTHCQEYRKWIAVRLVAELVAIRVTEDHLRKGSTATWVVDDVLYDTTDVSMTLTVVEGSEFGGLLLVTSVVLVYISCENRISRPENKRTFRNLVLAAIPS